MMMKLRILLELEEGQKSREVWKKSWRGVVWEAMKFWNSGAVFFEKKLSSEDSSIVPNDD